MLTEDPGTDRIALLRRLGEEDGFAVAEIEFLPVGGHGHNYRANGEGGPWFVSVKRGNSDPRRTARWALDFETSHRAVRRLVDEGGLEFLSGCGVQEIRSGCVNSCSAGRARDRLGRL